MALGLGSSLVKGGASLLTYVKDNLKLYLDFTSNKSDTLKFPSEGSTEFNGSSDYIETSDSADFDFGTGDFSISFWFNVDDIDWNWAVSRANSANSADLYRAGTNNSGKIIFRDIAGGTDIVGSTTVSINTWYHFQATRNSGTLKLYLNGSEDASGSSGGNFNSDKGFRVGRWQSSGDYWNGQLTNVAVWSRALAEEEVQSIMNKSYSQLKGVEKTSLVSWWALDTAPDTLGNNLITNGTFDSDLSSWSTSSSHWQWDNGRAYAYSGSNYQFRTSSVISWTTGATYNVSFDIEWVSGSSLSFYLDGTLTTITSDTTSVNQNVVHTSGAGYFQIYNNSSVVYIDNIVVKELKIKDSESTNHGSVTGATTTTSVYGGNAPILPRAVDVAKEGQADAIGNGSASFNGSSDYVDVGSDSSIDDIWTGGGTLSAWIYPRSDGESDFGMIAVKRNGNTSGWYLATNDESGGVCDIRLRSARDTADGGWATTSREITLNEWNHIAVSYDSDSDSNNALIYVNGISVAVTETDIPSGSHSSDASDVFKIGGEAGAFTYDGFISQLGIWQGELTQAQIQSLMESTSYSKIPADVKSTTNTLVTTGDWTLSGSWSYDSSTGYYTNTYVNSIDTPVGNILASPTTTQGNLYKLSYTVVSATGSPIIKFPNNMLGLSNSNIPYTVGETNVHYGVDDGSNENIGIRGSTGVGTIVLKDVKFEEVTNDIVAYYPLDGSSSRGNGTDDVTTGEVLGDEASADPNMEGSGNNDDPYKLTASQWTFNTTDNRLEYDDTSTGVVYQWNAYMANSFVANQLYRIKFTIGGLTSGVARLKFSAGDLAYDFVADNTVGYANGTHYAYFTTTESGSASNGFAVWGFVDSGSSWYFTELSFKPVTSNTGVLK